MSSRDAGRQNSADAAAMRDAMCARIRKLGADILAITRAAAAKVEELDAAHELQLQQQRKQRPSQTQPPQQLPMRLSPRPNVNSKSLRCSKPPPSSSAAAKAQHRPSLALRSVLGGRSTAAAAAAPTSSSLAAAAGGDGANGATRGGPRSFMSGASGHTGKRKTKSIAAAGRAAASSTASSPPPTSILPSSAPQDHSEAAAAATKTQNGVVVMPAAQGPTIQHCDPASAALDTDAAGATPAAAVTAQTSTLADVCRAAEESCHRVFDASLGGQEAEEAAFSCAPLYDLSNAASACHEGFSGSFTGGAAENSAEASWSAVVHTCELPEDAAGGVSGSASTTASIAFNSAALSSQSSASSAATPSGYYCVVYIHQCTRGRKLSGSSPGSGHSSSRSAALRRRLTPHMSSPSAYEREEEDAPRMVNSYVRAMYAGGESEVHPAGAAATGTTKTDLVAEACSGTAVELHLRVPTPQQRRPGSSVHTLTASHASTPSTGASHFPPTSTEAGRERQHVELTRSVAEEVRAATAAEAATTPTETQTAEVASAALVGSPAEAEVEAQIERMEGWCRDRRASVESRIRQRRHSAVMAPGWQGEYFYYSSPTRVSADPLSSHAHGEHGISPASHDAGSKLPPLTPPTTAANTVVVNDSLGYGTGPEEEELVAMAQRQLSPPVRPLHSPTGGPLLSMARAGSLTSAPAAAATTYDVLLLARPSASSSTTPRLSSDNNSGATAKDADQTRVDAAADDHDVDELGSSSGVGALGETHNASCTPPPPPPPAVSAAAAGGSSRRHHRPRLEVVVASNYNSMEWAFAGEARRASAVSDDAATAGPGEKREAVQGGMAGPSTPLWTAHQLREWAEEEHRRWNARTRQPHGADIHAPIVLHVQQ